MCKVLDFIINTTERGGGRAEEERRRKRKRRKGTRGRNEVTPSAGMRLIKQARKGKL